MKEILITGFVFLLGMTIGAIAHEHDIARTCKEVGHGGYASWTVEIKCSEMKSN